MDEHVFLTDKDRDEVTMSHTRGIWVRKNKTKDELEIWYDGVCQVTWDKADLILPRLDAMLREAVDIGKRARSEEIRNLIGAKSR